MNAYEILMSALPAIWSEHVVEHDGEPCLLVEPVATALGLDGAAQARQLMRDPERWGISSVAEDQHGAEPGRRRLCLSLRQVPSWLATIDAAQMRPGIAAWVARYQADERAQGVALPSPSGEQLIRDIQVMAADPHRRAATLKDTEAQLFARQEAIAQQLAEIDAELAELGDIIEFGGFEAGEGEMRPVQ